MSQQIPGFRPEEDWLVRECELVMFETSFTVEAMVPLNPDGGIESVQVLAWERFEHSKAQLVAEAERAIFSHYLEVIDEVRDRVGPEEADNFAPRISEMSELSNLVEPTELLFRGPRGSTDRVVGILLNCAWSPELGLAVKFVNERIDEVGPQDIVL